MNQTNLKQGDIVIIKDQGSKHQSRDPHIIANQEGSNIQVHRVLHSRLSSEKGLKFSHKTFNGDRKFLYNPFKSFPDLPNSETVNDSEPYIIPQRRKLKAKEVPKSWLTNSEEEDDS